jgi:hypothetical protein
MARNIFIKKRVSTLFAGFDLEFGDPVKLASDLDKGLEVELLDMAKVQRLFHGKLC